MLERSATLPGRVAASSDNKAFPTSRETIVVLREGSPKDVPLIILPSESRQLSLSLYRRVVLMAMSRC